MPNPNFALNRNPNEKTPPDIRLECYIIRIKKRNARSESVESYLPLDYIFSKKVVDEETGEEIRQPFGEIFGSFIGSFDNQFKVYKGGRAVFLETGKVRFASEQRLIYGIVEGGSTSLGGWVKKQQNDEEEILVTRDHVKGEPYYFLLYLPEDSQTGILIFQSFSDRTASSEFRMAFQNFIAGPKFDGPRVIFLNYISPETAEKFKRNCTLEKVSITRFEVPTDKGSKIFKNQYRPTMSFNLELKVTGKYALNELWQKATNYIDGEGQKAGEFFALEVLESLGFDDDSDVNFTTKYAGKQETITTKNNFKFSPNYYDTDSKIVRDENHLPLFDSVDTYCKDFLNKVKTESGIT